MKKINLSILLVLKLAATFTQNFYSIVIHSDQNCVDGIYAPAIENQDKGVSVLSQTIYRNNYGGKESLVGITQDGKIINKTIFLDSIQNTYSFDQLKNENSIYVCGTKFKYYDTIEVFWYAKFNSEYDTLWTKEIKTNYDRCFFQKIKPLKNHNIALCGSNDKKRPNSTASLTAEGLLVITDSLGNVIHYIEVNDHDTNTLEGFYDLTEDNDGSIYACGIVSKNDFNHDALIVKVSPAGKLLWRKQIPSPDYSEGLNYCEAQTNGSILFVGVSYKPNFFDDDFSYVLLINMDKNGNINFTKRIIKGFQNYNCNCVTDSIGNIICGRFYQPNRNKKADGWICKFTANGDSLWSRVIDNSEISGEQFFNIANASDGGFYLTGYSWIKGINSSKSWLVKVDSNGCVALGCTTGVNVEDEVNNKNIILYPNPARDLLNIYFNSKLSMEMNIELIDLQGRILTSKKIQQGADHDKLDVHAFPPGIYLLRLKNKKGIFGNDKVIIE